MLPKVIRGTRHDDAEVVHASCVSIRGEGVLIVGPSGSGKSNLALRLIDRGAILVADDCVCLDIEQQALIAWAPQVTRGLLEVRGVGLVEMPVAERARLALAVDTSGSGLADSMVLRGVTLRTISVPASRQSAPFMIELAMRGAFKRPPQ